MFFQSISELAALSCEELVLILHNNMVVLWRKPYLLSNVVSAFHLNEDIVLPSLCPVPKHPKEVYIACTLSEPKDCA